MSNYGWTNADGEPIMDGAAYRYEQYLDSTYEPDPDDFYNSYDEDEDAECDLSYDLDVFDGHTWCYTHDQYGDLCESDDTDEYDENDDVDEPFVMEDQWLDSYMEDRLSTMYE